MTETQLLLLAGACALLAAGLLLIAAEGRKVQRRRSRRALVVSKHRNYAVAEGDGDLMNTDLNQLHNQLISFRAGNPELSPVPSDFENIQVVKHWFTEAKKRINTRSTIRTREEQNKLFTVLIDLESKFNTLIEIANRRTVLTDQELNDLKLEDEKEKLRASIEENRARRQAAERREEARPVISEQERKFQAALEDEKRDRRWKARQALGKVHDLHALHDVYEEMRDEIERRGLPRKHEEALIEVLEQERDEQEQKIKKGSKYDIFER
jgi:hypothetical protein